MSDFEALVDRLMADPVIRWACANPNLASIILRLPAAQREWILEPLKRADNKYSVKLDQDSE